ncbi:hypothetical protein [uncultured Fibrella sp.]|uniref:hypothetical protein n=1 Tax=uncultured Fibrella sp. TaxID=1284596 RepID=UPI0035CC8D99
MSNRLGDFADDDVAGRKKIVDQIIELREQWKDCRYELETGQVRRPVAMEKPTKTTTGLSVAEIKVELGRIRTNISKLKDKLQERPEHKKAAEWQADLDRLIGLREAYEAEVADLKFANSGKTEEG